MTAPYHPDIVLTDVSLKTEDTAACHLNVQVSAECLSFAVRHGEQNRYFVLKSYGFQRSLNDEELTAGLDQLMLGEPLLTASYRSVTVLMDSQPSTLVPNALFNPDKKDLYLTFNHALDLSDKTVYTDHLAVLEAVNLYPVHDQVWKKLKNIFRNFKMVHFTSSLIQNILLHLPCSDHQSVMYIFVRTGLFDLIIRKDQRLVYSNSFRYKAFEDVVYYLIFVLEQLHVNTDEIHLNILGEIGKPSSLVDLLTKYIRNIGFVPRNDQYQFSSVFDELPGHYFYNLLNADMCEL